MDKTFYRAMLPLVNDKKQMELLLEYTLGKIALLQVQMETIKDHNRIIEMQGAIAELRRFRTLRDEVIKGSK
jgi:glycerol-3-phosphate responsive antiterminator|tara:strand:+ start:1402 stop:1617 length:216 start_codon:yes stop_codon:yes gene_type:complete